MAWITKKRDRWAVGFYDQDKKRRLKVLPKGSKKADARALCREIEEQVTSRSFIPEKNIPLFSKVAQSWIMHKKGLIRAITWEVYEGHVKHHFSEFDNLKINLIDTPMVEHWIDERIEDDMNIGTLKKILVTLNQIFTYAKRHNYIKVNPLVDAERPRTPKQKIVLLNSEQIKDLLKSTNKPKYKVLFTLAIFSGARQGELLGLRWQDVNWQDCQIHIQQNYTKGRFFPTKNEKERFIDMAPMVMDALAGWQEICPKTELGLVFPNGNGNPINYSNMMNRHFFPALEKAKLPRIKFHSLRHSYVSLLHEVGENVVYISKQLGHASPAITLNVYSHLFEKRNPEASKKLERKIFGDGIRGELQKETVIGDQLETKTLELTN